MKTFQSVYPFDQSIVEEYALMDENTIDHKIALAEKAFKAWSHKDFDERSEVLKKAAFIFTA